MKRGLHKRTRGLDTNVLIRYITCDEPRQTAAAKRLIETAEAHGERLRVSAIVLCELAWTLSGRLYRYSRSSIAAVIDTILEIPLFEVDDRDVVRRAVAAYRDGPGDFPDYLIGEQNRHAGSDPTVTFDTKLAASEYFEVIRPLDD